MATVFSKIISGEIPAYIIAENKDFLAFLDINPLVKGHTLVIPKKETDLIFDIEDDAFQALFLFAKKIAKQLQKSISCKKVGIAVIGLEVAHAHIHLVPLQQVSDLDFSKPKLKLDHSEMEEILKKISIHKES